MTGHEIDKYLLPAIINIYKTDVVVAGSLEARKLLSLIDEKYVLEFEHWLNINKRTVPSPPMDNHLRNILIALAGPHGRTLLKMLEINKVKRRR